MTDQADTPAKGTPKDTHYARLRREHRARVGQIDGKKAQGDDANVPMHLYGLHTVRAALENPARRSHRLLITENAGRRLGIDPNTLSCPVETVHPAQLDRLLGGDAVHQGVALETDPLPRRTLEDLGDARLLIVLDQVTDPHNVGALMRSATALGADALITTARHSPQQTGVLAKAASGALDHLPLVSVRNLANALTELNNRGFETVGLDSEGPAALEDSLTAPKIAIVLGAEGKGLREKTRQTVTRMARLDMLGPIRSLNVSNAAVLALYVARRHLDAG